MTGPGSEPTISRSEVNHANHYSIGPLLENWQIVMRQKVSELVSVLPE